MGGFCDAKSNEEAVLVKSSDTTKATGWCKSSSRTNKCGACGSEADCGCNGQFPSCCWASKDAWCGSETELQTKPAEEVVVAKSSGSMNGTGFCKSSSPYNKCGHCTSEADCRCTGQFPSCCWASKDAHCGGAGSWMI